MIAGEYNLSFITVGIGLGNIPLWVEVYVARVIFASKDGLDPTSAVELLSWCLVIGVFVLLWNIDFFAGPSFGLTKIPEDSESTNE